MPIPTLFELSILMLAELLPEFLPILNKPFSALIKPVVSLSATFNIDLLVLDKTSKVAVLPPSLLITTLPV